VAYVALEDRKHNGTGYFIDRGRVAESDKGFELWELPGRIAAALGQDVNHSMRFT